MPAYVIVDIDLHDPVGYEAYKRDVPALIARHGGEYVVRGGEHEVLEGNWAPHRLVVLRFPSRDAARAFFADPAYAPLKVLRQRTADTNAVIVEGIA